MERTILIVDDAIINRKIIAGSLKNKLANITIIEAEDGFEALRILKKEPISVVILDIVMPDKDGLEVLQTMKKRPEMKNIPVIICSALSEIKNIEKALSMGALDYFSKPLNSEQMQITLPIKVSNALEYYQQKIQLIKFYDHIKEEMQLAEELQKAMISNHAVHKSFEMWGRYIPCEDIGGDMFVCKTVGEKDWLMIADVSGHGISAAMISTMINVLFDGAIRQYETPGAVLQSLNKSFLEIFRNSTYGLISAFVGCVVENRLIYANAGHPYPFLVKQHDGKINNLNTNGFLLGLMDNPDYQSTECDFTINDSLILYTDGLFDNGKNGEFANWNLIREYYEDHLDEFETGLDNALNRMIDFFSNRRTDGFIDDAAMMIIRKNH